jgi:hypothetical protein
MLAMVVIVGMSRQAAAQSRPLVTEDPETVPAGDILVEGGLDYDHSQFYPASGLTGNLLRIGTLGLSFGVSSIAEIQLDGGVRNHLSITDDVPAPLSDMLDIGGDATSTSDFEDLVIGTKVRFLSETASRPAVAVRFSTRLPNATNAVAPGVEVVGEINGRLNTRNGEPPVGTESRSMVRLGARLTRGPVRLDGALAVGVTENDPSWGFTTGFTWVFKAFTVQ